MLPTRRDRRPPRFACRYCHLNIGNAPTDCTMCGTRICMARRLQVEQDCRAHQSRMAERAVSCGWLLKDFAESGELPLPESLPPYLTVHTLKRFGQHILDIAAERDSHAQTNTRQHAFQQRSCRFAIDFIDNVNNTSGVSPCDASPPTAGGSSSSCGPGDPTGLLSGVNQLLSVDELAAAPFEPLRVTIPEDCPTCEDQRPDASDGNVAYVKL